MNVAIQYDLFKDPYEVLILEIQRLETQLAKQRRSMFARINALENDLNKIMELMAIQDTIKLRSS